MLTRRTALLACAASAILPGAARAADRFAAALAGIEARSTGRLGVAVLDTASGQFAGYRADEAFPICSTYKALVAGAILARADRGEEDLNRRIRYRADDLVAYSPATKPHAGPDGMPVAALCEAAVTLSDNTAANLLLAACGGPAGLTAFLRAIGDGHTRLDRTEPTLNQAAPGDPRDTTTPRAIAIDLQRLLFGSALRPVSQARLAGWLVACRTGDHRLRAGLPAAWRVGDKTGSGENGTANDVAVVWPPGRAPTILAAYLTGVTISPEQQNATLAAVARAATEGETRPWP